MILILTPGERLWLESRRRGWTRRRIAEIYRPEGSHRPVALSTVDRWFHEKGNVPQVVLGEPTLRDKCAIARRRRGLSVPALSKLSGIEATEIALAEKGLMSPKPLARYWSQTGWPPFPIRAWKAW